MPSLLPWSLLYKIEHWAIPGTWDEWESLEQERFSLGGGGSDWWATGQTQAQGTQWSSPSAERSMSVQGHIQQPWKGQNNLREKSLEEMSFPSGKRIQEASNPHLVPWDPCTKWSLRTWPVRWTEIRLNCQAQRVVVSSTKSGWNLMTSNAPEVISLNLFLKIIHWRRAYVPCQM